MILIVMKTAILSPKRLGNPGSDARARDTTRQTNNRLRNRHHEEGEDWSDEMKAKKTATNGAKPIRKATTSRKKAKPKKAKQELTADELLMIGWKRAYENRDRRLT